MRLAALGLLALVLFVATGCRVSTTVSVSQTSSGAGDLAVAVTFDGSALAAVGGLSGLSSQLQTADLRAAGWTVSGPAPSGSGAVVTVSHPFQTGAEAAQLFGALAGSGPPATRPFRLELSRRSTFWHVYSDLSGTVDLTCGVDCFGDPALKAATGQTTGVDTAPLVAQAGQTPAQVFTFELQARLPGHVNSTNATTHSVTDPGVLGWTPRMGQRRVLSAETESWNRGSLILVGSAAAVVVVAIPLFLVGRWIRRRRRRKRGAHVAAGEAVSGAGGGAPSGPDGGQTSVEGSSSDGGPGEGAGSSPDGGPGESAGSSPDGGPGEGAGSSPDGGQTSVEGSSSDGAPAEDAGSGPVVAPGSVEGSGPASGPVVAPGSVEGSGPASGPLVAPGSVEGSGPVDSPGETPGGS